MSDCEEEIKYNERSLKEVYRDSGAIYNCECGCGGDFLKKLDGYCDNDDHFATFSDEDIEAVAEAIYNQDPTGEFDIVDNEFEWNDLSYQDLVIRDALYEGNSVFSPEVALLRSQAIAALDVMGFIYKETE